MLMCLVSLSNLLDLSNFIINFVEIKTCLQVLLTCTVNFRNLHLFLMLEHKNDSSEQVTHTIVEFNWMTVECRIN